jgi:hypothetical protein
MQIFEDNGTSGQDIYRHPHFARHLRYFLLGPDLPPRVIADFAQALADCGQVTSGDQEGLQRLGRTLVRTFGLDRRLAAEEFFKLAVELGLDTTYARGIRDSVMKIKAR